MVSVFEGDSGVVRKVSVSAFKRRRDRFQSRSPRRDIEAFCWHWFVKWVRYFEKMVRSRGFVKQRFVKLVRYFEENFVAENAVRKKVR